jgi:hypothetical protein
MNRHPGNLAGKPPMGLKQTRQANGTAKGRAHMARVKALPCVICGKPGPSDAHHVFCGRYGQSKASDFETIPLCKECHQIGPLAIHNDKAGWIARNGPDTDYLPVVADQLAGEFNSPWRNSPPVTPRLKAGEQDPERTPNDADKAF